MSLQQLAIGLEPMVASAFLAAPLPGAPFAEAPVSAAERANLRLQASLRQRPAGADRQGGPGPEGPVVAAARQLISGDETLLETSAVLNVRIDGGGRVTEVHLLDATSQNAAWQMIAARLAKDLGVVSLQRGGASQGWNMKLRLSSAVQLPSGAAPGLRTDVLGQALPGSAKPGATSLSLSPTSPIFMPKPIDDVGRQMDRVMTVELGLLKLKGDVADLAATARRVIHVAVLAVDEPTRP